MGWQFLTADDVGGRSEQQDRCAVLHAADGQTHLAVLADGVGGHGYGSLAAQQVIDVAARHLATRAVDDPTDFLEALCSDAHRVVLQLDRDASGASCSTCVFLLLRGTSVCFAHVGDSRLYLVRDGRALQQTEDHSLRQLQINSGVAPEDATVPANQLYMTLGCSGTMEPLLGGCRPADGDTFLLCSDGFWGNLDLNEVARSLACSRFDEALGRGWVQQAKRAGGEKGDNISLVLARYEAEPDGILERLWHRLRRLLRRERRRPA